MKYCMSRVCSSPDMPAFGIHVCAWSAEAEEVAAERIRAASRKRLLGDRFPARDSWYKRKCLSRVYFLSPLLLLIGLAMFRTKVLPALRLYSYVSTFESTTCTTDSSNTTEAGLLCDCRARTKSPEKCERPYPCLKLIVTLETGDGHRLTTAIYEDMQALHVKFQDCAVLVARCPKDDPGDTVESLLSHYGDPGSTFRCFYNPDEPHDVLVHRSDLPDTLWVMTALTLLLMVVSLVAPVIAYLTCGCMYVCTARPPRDIQAEVDRRAARGAGGGGGIQEVPSPGPMTTGEGPDVGELQPLAPSKDPQTNVAAAPPPVKSPVPIVTSPDPSMTSPVEPTPSPVQFVTSSISSLALPQPSPRYSDAHLMPLSPLGGDTPAAPAPLGGGPFVVMPLSGSDTYYLLRPDGTVTPVLLCFPPGAINRPLLPPTGQ